jgi:outer membrane lipoprotein-sorting protein
MSVPAQRTAISILTIVVVSGALLTRAAADTAPHDSFDELYERGQKVNAAIKTLTAHFTETTTSKLLTKPIVARGRLSVERPTRVILRYADDDTHVVLIDGNTMTVAWPSRNVNQKIDIGSSQGRVQKYFVNGSAADLRRQFDIDDRAQGDSRPNTYHVSMVPKRKQIREALARLELWVGRTSMLLDAMKMTFADGDTKTMTFEDVVPNAVLEAGTFKIER